MSSIAPPARGSIEPARDRHPSGRRPPRLPPAAAHGPTAGRIPAARGVPGRLRLAAVAGNTALGRLLPHSDAPDLVRRNDDPPEPPPPPPPAPDLDAPSGAPGAWKRTPKYALDTEFGKRGRNLFDNPTEGSFEYVAQYLYASYDGDKRAVFDKVYEAVKDGDAYRAQPKTLDDTPKRELLGSLIDGSLKKYGGDQAPLLDNMADFAGLEQEDQPTTHKGPLPKAVAIGFHGTSGKPSQVKSSTSAGGWGGLKRPINVPLFRTRYGLDEGWNPLKDRLGGDQFFRMGENWDNELLSTVSISTRPTPAIKFPFPSGSGTSATGWLYATVVEKAFPTYKIQKDKFPEVATGDIDADDLIGYQVIRKNYDPGTVKFVNEKYGLGFNNLTETKDNEQFAYFTTGFLTNRSFTRKWGDAAEAIVDKAKGRVGDEIGSDRGVYKDMKVGKV